jgi:hypothetical protein
MCLLLNQGQSPDEDWDLSYVFASYAFSPETATYLHLLRLPGDPPYFPEEFLFLVFPLFPILTAVTYFSRMERVRFL